MADDSGFGGTVMQYQVLLDPAKIYNYHIAVTAGDGRAGREQRQRRRRLLLAGLAVFLRARPGPGDKTEDIGNIVVGNNNGVPVRIRDIGEVTIGNAPRLGEFGFEKNDDAVEGVILMLRGEQTQNVLKRVEKKTEELNNGILPPDVKIRPFYDRSDLVRLTIDTVEAQPVARHELVLIVLIFFLVSVRAAVIVALTIPLSLLFAFIFLHGRGVPANLLSIGAIDFGIIIDGTVVMMENIYRELGRTRTGRNTNCMKSSSRRRTTWTGPSFIPSRSFLPDTFRSTRSPARRASFSSHGRDHVLRAAGLADFHSHVRAGARLVLVQSRRQREVNAVYEWVKGICTPELDWCLDHPKTHDGRCDDHFRRHAAPGALHRRRIHAAPR